MAFLQGIGFTSVCRQACSRQFGSERGGQRSQPFVATEKKEKVVHV